MPLIDRFPIICYNANNGSQEFYPSFILELPVKTDDYQARILQKRFEAARQIYNTYLGESMRSLNLIRQSKTHQKARKMLKDKERSQLFRDLNLRFDFSEYSLWAYSTKLRTSRSVIIIDSEYKL